MEAIGHAGTCLGILASDGVLLAAERKNTNKLLDDVIFSEKIYRLDKYARMNLMYDSHYFLLVAVTWHVVWLESPPMQMSSLVISDRLHRGESGVILLCNPRFNLIFHCRYMLRYQECIPCEQLVMQLCDIKQAYTQFGGERYSDEGRMVRGGDSLVQTFLDGWGFTEGESGNCGFILFMPALTASLIAREISSPRLECTIVYNYNNHMTFMPIFLNLRSD